MAWLRRDGEVLSSVTLATTFGARLRGWLGRDRVEGALLLRPARSVHSLGMRFDLDVAFLDADLVVLRVVRLRRWRPGWGVLRARSVLEAPAGAFEQWRLAVGDRLAIDGDR